MKKLGDKISLFIFTVMVMVLVIFIICYYQAYGNISKHMIIIISLYVVYAITILLKKYLLSFIIYCMVVVNVMLVRISAGGLSQDMYLLKWFKVMFTNRVVFINIFGNIFLFIPLPIYVFAVTKKVIYIVAITLGIIIMLESIQYFANVGVFDYVDIILNSIGGLIGLLFGLIYGEHYEKRRKET